MRRKIIVVPLLLLFLFSTSVFISAASTTSYNFRVLNSPDQRQVAYNIAKAQHDMSLEEDKLAQFIAIIEGRIMSIITEDIVTKMLGDGFSETGEASYDTNSLDILVVENDDGTVTINVRNKITGEKGELVYNPAQWPDLSAY